MHNGNRRFHSISMTGRGAPLFLLAPVATAFIVALLLMFASKVHGADDVPTSAPEAGLKYELPKIPDAFANDDAVILRWWQTWRQSGDGTVTQHEIKHVLVRNDRAYGAFADPRLTYNKDWQTLKILVARTRTPDGRVVDVPPYSRNEVAPYESAGWPAFASIQQTVLTFSALEPGAILELEWERTTKPGMKSVLEVEEPASVDYPSLHRKFIVEAGENQFGELHDVAALIEEPQCRPNVERCSWFIYPLRERTSGNGWFARRITAIDRQSAVSADLRAISEEWCKGKSSTYDKAKEIQTRLAKMMHFVGVQQAFLPDTSRSPIEILRSRYASARESTILLLALFRAAGLDAAPAVIADRRGAVGNIDGFFPGRNGIDAECIRVETADGSAYWSPAGGVIRLDDGCVIKSIHRLVDGKIARDESADSKSGPRAGSRLRYGPEMSELDLTLHLTIADNGTWTGNATIDASRVFRRGKDLMTEDERRQYASGVLERMLPKAEVVKVSVQTLSDERARLGMDIKSREPITEVDGCRMLTLAQNGPWSRDVSIPLSSSARKSTMRIADAFAQSIKLSVDFPKSWTPMAAPRPVGAKDAADAFAWQTIEMSTGRAEFEQRVTIGNCEIDAAQYTRLRSALTELQTDSARTFLWRGPDDSAKKVN